MHANFITSSYIEAAEDLGASPWQQFFKIGKRREKEGKKEDFIGKMKFFEEKEKKVVEKFGGMK